MSGVCELIPGLEGHIKHQTERKAVSSLVWRHAEECRSITSQRVIVLRMFMIFKCQPFTLSWPWTQRLINTYKKHRLNSSPTVWEMCSFVFSLSHRCVKHEANRPRLAAGESGSLDLTKGKNNLPQGPLRLSNKVAKCQFMGLYLGLFLGSSVFLKMACGVFTFGQGQANRFLLKWEIILD